MLSSVKICPATSRDVGDMMRIRVAVKENALSEERLAALGITEASLVRMLGSDHGGWCAEVEGEVVAFAMVNHTQGTIFALFVHPDFEGRGVGSALLEAAVAHLAAAGHQRLTLTTGEETRAFRFYLARGWKPTGAHLRDDAELELTLSSAATWNYSPPDP